MVSVINANSHTFYGKSTDEKPTDSYGSSIDVRNGDVFYETDTQKVYIFDKDSSTWDEQ